MKKEEYLAVRERIEIPSWAWYAYYVERGGKHTFEYFWENFQVAIYNTLTTISTIPQKTVNLETALNNFYKYYNKKFNV